MSLKRIWITWERHRRSIELAKELGCELHIIERNGLLRYPASILETLILLVKERAEIVFVQNPSMILTTLVCIYKKLWGTFLIVDRHTTFLLNKRRKNTPVRLVYRLLSLITVRIADLTIVTNDYLFKLVKDMGGKPFVLPDKLPEFELLRKTRLKGKKNLVMISSFGEDEPIRAILTAMREFERDDVYLYITGDERKLDQDLRCAAPINVIFTGFLPEEKFLEILNAADAVIVLTTADACLLCGCYEAVAVGKPLITSDKEALKSYFTSAIFVENSASGISEGIRKALDNLEFHRESIISLRDKLSMGWSELFKQLQERLPK